MDKMVLFTMKGSFTPALFSLVESRQSCPPLFVLAGVNVALAPNKRTGTSSKRRAVFGWLSNSGAVCL